MRKFTDKELELAPKVAEIFAPDGPVIAGCCAGTIGKWITEHMLEHDCLEFLREHDFAVFTETFPSGESNVHVCGPGTDIVERGNWTLLEALYRVIIECGQKQGKGE